MKDSILWTSFKAGSINAFSKLYCTYRKCLFYYGCRITSDTDLVKDSIQDIFLDLWVRRNNLSEVLSVKYYLFKCLRRRIVKAILKIDAKGQGYDFSQDEPVEIFLPDEASTAKASLIQQMLFKLTKRQREAIYLRFYNNLDTKGIATAMALSAKGAANLISKSLVALRSDFKNS